MATHREDVAEIIASPDRGERVVATGIALGGSAIFVAVKASYASTGRTQHNVAHFTPEGARQLAYDLLNHADIATNDLLLQQLLSTN